MRSTAEMAALLETVPATEITGPRTGVVSAVAYSSSEVTSGACFVAIRGRKADGHAYIADALARGALLIVGEDAAPVDLPPDRTYARVADARRELGRLAAAFHDDPSHRMDVIGVTGTDGKTTTTTLIDAILTAGGRRTGLMSTVDFKIGGERWPNTSRFTTLEAPEVQALLARMAGADVECAIIETTSSGLALHRVWGIAYDVAVVTNITSEHLEVHGSKDAYWRAKAMLLEMVDPAAQKSLPFAVPHTCVLNADDDAFAYLRPFCRAPVLSYSIGGLADIVADELDLGADGSRFRVRLPDGRAFPVTTRLVARYNVSNCLAALAVGYAHGLAPEVIARALATFPGVPGRMERVDAGQPFAVVVDYAHTADSLEKVLNVLRPLTTGRLLVVFGSAGERDRVKRPEMGAVAARLADFAVITDEDPREEDAASILREIAAGAEAAGAREGEHYRCVVGRREGIALAMRLARPGDTLLLAGKGHERSLIVGREKHAWDERQVAYDVLAELGYTAAPPDVAP
ncbi:MAG: UDP-N-acetylmuramoyl-L-alanyl-D-glutamate--2,6-diaminopimelate ligase [Ktedonobacterales bacterium]|nr:UDP-N-acetylmuramoyl-L-alanyl-D-glutamate--2,6-diaminopimelate ligase [Ktedonobacterales bacterium]